METRNYIAFILNDADALGGNFTQATYGALAANLAPLLAGLFALYLVFWGYGFWQGRGEGHVTAIAFRLMRVALIFFFATSWGPVQTFIYRGVTNAPMAISGVMLSNIENGGRGVMPERTVERDLFDFYQIAVLASIRIAEQSSAEGNGPGPGPAPNGPAQPAANPDQSTIEQPPPQNPFALKLDTIAQSILVWLSSVLFIGYSVFVILFAKIALLALLALAPIFIILLIFQVPSRFFSGWLTATIQMMLVSIFLYVFLAFYLISIKSVVIALKTSLDRGDIPTMKEAAPFVLVCFSGFFLLLQIVPLSGRIAASTREWVTTGAGKARGQVTAWTRSARTSIAAPANGGDRHAASPVHGFSSSSETILRDLQEQNAALDRMRRNR